MTITLQEVFATSFDDYASTRRLPIKHYKAAESIITCRTPAQGGHVQRCPDGHEQHIQYHSCRHRSCPQCNSFVKEQWLQRQRERLLPMDHYHAIFTLPHEFHGLWRFNQRQMTQLLFKSVSETLLTLCRDRKYMGGVPGMMLTLHSWGRNLSLHPHIHCLISGGGLDHEGRWREVKNSFLLPSRVVRKVYRGKMLALIRQGLDAGELTWPPGDREVPMDHLLSRVTRKHWHVQIQPPYRHGKGVMMYLARYVKGGPLSSRKLLSVDAGSVSFRYQDHRDGQNKQLQLEKGHFLGRLLEHVPEPGQNVVRHYGLYGHRAKAKRQQVREALGLSLEQDAQPISWETFLQKLGDKTKGCCKVCGKSLVMGVRVIKNSFYREQVVRNVQQGAQRGNRNVGMVRTGALQGKPIFFWPGDSG
ncbi:MAG: IS91 family transposase [Gammaproteobacteria bacterium]|nr:IS91 family transposase [Gammaproteobacteria bacterium]MDH5547688.1 IS91 family transposase [Gammaproteobacteria bacterium]